MIKNGIYEGIVVGLGSEGEGIIKTEGTTAFVPFCLEGEKVRFKALKVKGNVAYGKLESVLNAAYSRTNPPCPVFGKCGGCDLQHMNYAAQLEFKRGVVQNALKKIGGIDFAVSEVVPCGSEYRYRNKLALPIGDTGCGFYAPHSHRIVVTDDCLIQSDWVKKVIAAVEKFALVKHIAGYNEETGEGILRRIVVREIKGKFIFALVVTRKIDVKFLIGELEKDFGEFTFLLNINAARNNAIFSEEWHICRGSGYFEAEECGIKYRAGANTFLQVNDDVRGKLYARVLEEATAGCVALDLYSGAGMLTAMLAKKCGRAYGIEVVEEASRCADELKEANGLQGRMFNICGKVEEKIAEVFAATRGAERLIVCDPPRKGMERSVTEAIAASGADKIVLVSCNPATLARDLGILTGTLEERDGVLIKTDNMGGAPTKSGCIDGTQTKLSCVDGALTNTGCMHRAYEIVSVTPFDMFPQTKHVETLVTLFHKKPDSHIEITVDIEDGKIKKDGIIERAESKKPKEKPTYKMIQKWVEENYGLKVHTAYIAEVKRDLGLPMYDAPNAVEELKRPRPHPTPKMVEAIKAALKHFEIIS